jgi:hypothetical protein
MIEDDYVSQIRVDVELRPQEAAAIFATVLPAPQPGA